jgi:formylglycine-generating enzyme required for sulfatase activity
VSNTNNGFNRIGGISAAGNCNIQIKNSILWNNSTNQYGSFSSGPGGNATFTFSYSNIQGGTSATVGGNTKTLVTTGAGCINSDPVFAETTNYTLGTGSPAINTGDPNAAKDADGSRADMGWDSTLANAGSDTDGDGVSDYREIQDGTNPSDPTSFRQISKGLVAYYTFNGTYANDAGAKADAMPSNSVAFIVDPFFGKVAKVTGAGHVGQNGGSIEIPKPSLNQGNLFTASFWIKEHGMSSWHGESYLQAGTGGGSRALLGHFGSDSGPPHQFCTNSGLVDSNPQSSSFNISASQVIEVWNHYTIVEQGGLVSVSMNGKEIYTLNTSGLPRGNWHIGRHWWDGGASQSTRLIASLANLRIYNRALTAAEVTQLYSAESGEPNTVLVQGGTLPTSSALANQTVSAFHIARLETTWAEWKDVRTWAIANGYDIGGSGNALGDSHPVHSMTWQQILKWLNAKSEMEGLVPVYRIGGSVYKTGLIIPTILPGANGYRLPIEAEWEWASRGGVFSQGFTYSGSNNLEEVAWYQANNTPQGTKAVGLKKPNELGLYDMSGNCWEYCWDLVTVGKRRIRGGGCWDTPGLMAYRWDADTSQPWVNFGFRYVRNAIGDMVTVHGGALPAGSTLAGQQVQTFQIGRTEVTWGEWKTVRTWAAANGYDIGSVGEGSSDSHPVLNVNWYDALKWCNARSEQEGLTPAYYLNGIIFKNQTLSPFEAFKVTRNSSASGYRLPTILEWEWAARGGVASKGYTYSGSNDANAVAWSIENSNGGLQPVGEKLPNELGIHDMSGNVWEWCWWGSGPTSDAVPILGGSWSLGSQYSRIDHGGGGYPDNRNYFNAGGFRLARNAQ